MRDRDDLNLIGKLCTRTVTDQSSSEIHVPWVEDRRHDLYLGRRTRDARDATAESLHCREETRGSRDGLQSTWDGRGVESRVTVLFEALNVYRTA